MKRYFSLAKEGRKARLDIYGNITSCPWMEGDMSAKILSTQLDELGDVDEIEVHINSYGGEVAEGLAIYNALRGHTARVKTVCDGLACSIASVIFMAGDERVMRKASLLMIHNAWAYGEGNAAELRKQADDLDAITEASKVAYLSRISIDAEELTALMDAETWIAPERAVEMGFATAVDEFDDAPGPSQCALRALVALAAAKEADPEDPDDPDDPEAADDTGGGEDSDDPGDDGDDEEKPKEALQRLGRFFNAINQ
ncbi:head maturation protease, ClpP-related [uncultured Adlercreutzia sp.]|uniref:head maturation protease, ClpP-related n=1 Tax=uncultured Adlercreutzia sp. TaxID=875803 RepID=UPI0025870E30|nr:head maturation protease, ClpP-related [uncultured Adlercreutzia sp.]